MTTPTRTFCALLFALPLAAQAASSTTNFLVASETGGGGSTQSTAHRLAGTLSSGVPAVRATSTGFVLVGGFPAALDTTATGTVWLTGVLPAYGPLLGGTALTLYGSELNQGPAQITIGGVAAVPGVGTNATLPTVLPAQFVPGYRSVTVQNSIGSSTLPAAFGVLPLIDFPVAPQPNRPSRLRYLGAQGDLIVLALSTSLNPGPVAMAPFHHGVQIDLSSVLASVILSVTDPSGELTIALPAVGPSLPIHFQCLSLSQNAGWSPGSFTNIARL